MDCRISLLVIASILMLTCSVAMKLGETCVLNKSCEAGLHCDTSVVMKQGERCVANNKSCDIELCCQTCVANGNVRPQYPRIQPINPLAKNGVRGLMLDMYEFGGQCLNFTAHKETSEGIDYDRRHFVENQYGDGGMGAGSCPNRAESPSMNATSSFQVLVNYFTDSTDRAEPTSIRQLLLEKERRKKHLGGGTILLCCFGAMLGFLAFVYFLSLLFDYIWPERERNRVEVNNRLQKKENKFKKFLKRLKFEYIQRRQ